MYRRTGSSKVEVWGGKPVQNAQLQFNQMHFESPVVVKVHTLESGEVADAPLNPVEAATMRIKLMEQRKLDQRQALERFRKSTLLRLAAWKEQEEARETTFRTTSKITMNNNQTQARESSQADGDESMCSTDLERSLEQNRLKSSHARENLLRFTRGRRSFRVVSILKSPTMTPTTKRRIKSSPAASLFSSPATSPLSTDKHGRQSQVEVRFESMDTLTSDEMFSNTSSSFDQGHPNHQQVGESTRVESVRQGNRHNDHSYEPTLYSTFVGREEFKHKEKMALHKEQVRKREAAFGRLLARRKKALASHRKQQALEKEAWIGSKQSHQMALQHQEEQPIARQDDKENNSTVRQARHSNLPPPPPHVQTKPPVKDEEDIHKRREKEESLRYLTALQHRLKEMAETKNGVRLPALCNCGSSFPRARGAGALFHYEAAPSGVDGGLAPWEHCANNCRFYKNPQAYARELADIFRSLEL